MLIIYSMIEILLAAFNGEKYIKNQIRSILAGSFQDFHITVRDDGSTDGTVSIVKHMVSRYPEKLRLISGGTPTGSATGNFMQMLHDLPEDTEYVMFCDQDDLWSRHKISDSLSYLKDMEAIYGVDKPLLMHTDLMVVNEEGSLISRSLIEYMQLPRTDDLKHLLLQNSVTGCTVLFNRPLLSLLKRAFGHPEIIIHDHFAAVLAAALGHVGCLKIPTVKYRQHEENVVGAANAKSLSYKLARFKRGRLAFLASMEDTYRQARLIAELYPEEVFSMNDEDRRLLIGYGDLIDKPREERVSFFRANDMYKRSFTRAVMQMFWC